MTTDQITTDLTERLERGRAQLLEAMSAVSEDRTCCGWAADWARTLHAEGGIWETLGRAVGWPTGNYDAWVWMSWDEAAALYGHAVSSVGQAPATDQTALRDRIAEAIADALKPRYGGPQHNTPGGLPLTATAEQIRLHRAQPLADAVLAVLPAPTGWAAEWRAAADHLDALHLSGVEGGIRNALTTELRRMAVEAAVPGRTTDETSATWTPPPPGDTREQLPDHLLTAIGGVLGKYYSTACHTATACQAAAYRQPGLAGELRAQAAHLHSRCRLNQKFTGQLCVCGCHNDAPAVGGAQQPTEADTCRPVDVDGETIRVHGGSEMTDEDRDHFADVIRAAKRKYLAEHPEADA